MLFLKEEGSLITVMFSCEACGEKLPIADCAEFCIETDLMMLCQGCDEIYKKSIKPRNLSDN